MIFVLKVGEFCRQCGAPFRAISGQHGVHAERVNHDIRFLRIYPKTFGTSA